MCLVDGNFSQFKPLVSADPQDNFLGYLPFLLYSADNVE